MRPSSITPRDLEHMLCDETAEPKPLPLLLLDEITDGFSDNQRIGIGGFAVVYKGKLQNRAVAVKRMSNAFMDEVVFHRELQCLMIAKHKNIVRFLGYCADRQGIMEKYEGKFIMADVHQRLLCFEYLPKGSLCEYITDASSGLQWRDRYHIIKGICQGLNYLHHKNIVHLDLKPGNILLDGNLVAKIADFGLSRCFDEKQSRIITLNIGGTLGYLAPEFDNGEITYKFDIYSLGVLIIEILTGKKGYHAVEKVVQSWSNRLEEARIELQLEQVRVCAEIGIECANFNPANRPDTQHIICRLDGTESMDKYIDIGVIKSRQDESSAAVTSSAYIPAADMMQSVASAQERAFVEHELSLPPPAPAMVATVEYYDDYGDDLNATWNAIMQQVRPTLKRSVGAAEAELNKRAEDFIKKIHYSFGQQQLSCCD